MRRLILPGIPFALSLALSLSTAGSHCYWQDSGFFLVAVKELGILYPPGFALYVLLCKAWTLALWFVDFTYAVHLFSAVCAAAAAGTIAVAARDLLRTKGPIFRTIQEEGPLPEWVGASIGCLAASGYTFWAAAILAKVYAFYYLILALLIWRMIRADESGRPRDFTIVAALIGLAWQAHPSATLVGLALVLFVGYHRKIVGWKGLLWRTGLAALCAIGPIHLLPLFKKAGGSALQLGEPDTLAGFFEYVSGSRFTMQGRNFGIEGSRVASVGRYFWEEFLGIGGVLLGAGVVRLWTVNRRLLLALAAWVVPVLVITVLFKLEGQHDFWFVAAWIPLWLAAAVGMSMVGRLREAAVAMALIGTIWAVIANRSDLDQRNYTLAETLGRYYLSWIPELQYFATASDDAYAITLYLEHVRGVPTSVHLIAPHRSEEAGLHSLRFMGNVYFESAIGARWGYVPAGPLFRKMRRGETPTTLEEWKEPIPAEEIPKQFRRARGQYLERRNGEFHVIPEAYEHRFLRALLLARKNKADVRAAEGKHAEALALYESILKLDPWMAEEPTVVFPLAILYVGVQNYEKAEATFRKALSLDLDEDPVKRPQAYYFLAALCGTRPEAAEWKAKALASKDLPQELRAKLEGR